MRILKLCYEFPPIGGGGSRVVSGLSRELAARGHEIDLVTMGFQDLPAFEELDRIRVHRVPCVRRSSSSCSMPEALSYAPGALWKARSLAASNPPDLIHAHFILPDGLITRQLARRAPIVITAHGSDVPGYNPHQLGLAHVLLQPVWRWIVDAAGQVVCPSEMLRDLVLQARPSARAIVIPNGIDPARFSEAKQSKRILVVTRMIERKGVQHVIRALADDSFGYEVHVVGDGPYLPTLRELAERLGAPVKFWGWLDNDDPQLRELYESSSVFAFPSEAENFPICLLEAMAARLAIVTSRGTGCAEVVGDAGELVNAGDPDEIRNALAKLCSQPERIAELGRLARKRLEDHFSWTAVADAYERVYQRLAG